MKCTLRITDGPAAEQSIIVQPGETLTVGRSDRANYAIPNDGLLSGLHFSVRCEPDACTLQDLGSTNHTLVNGQPVTRRVLHSEDLIQAGDSQFRVLLEEEQPGPGRFVQQPTSVGTATRMPEPEEFPEVPGYVSATAIEI